MNTVETSLQLSETNIFHDICRTLRTLQNLTLYNGYPYWDLVANVYTHPSDEFYNGEIFHGPIATYHEDENTGPRGPVIIWGVYCYNGIYLAIIPYHSELSSSFQSVHISNGNSEYWEYHILCVTASDTNTLLSTYSNSGALPKGTYNVISAQSTPDLNTVLKHTNYSTRREDSILCFMRAIEQAILDALNSSLC